MLFQDLYTISLIVDGTGHWKYQITVFFWNLKKIFCHFSLKSNGAFCQLISQKKYLWKWWSASVSATRSAIIVSTYHNSLHFLDFLHRLNCFISSSCRRLPLSDNDDMSSYYQSRVKRIMQYQVDANTYRRN